MPFSSLAFIDGVGGPEMVLIFLLILLLFGGKKLPDFARGLGKSMREFKRAAAGVEDEIKRAIDSAPSSEPPPTKPAPRIEAAKPPVAPVAPIETYEDYPVEEQGGEPVAEKPAEPPEAKPKDKDKYPEDPKDFLS